MTRCDICQDLQPPYTNILIPFSDLAESAQSNSCPSCRLLYNGIIAREEDKNLIEDVSLSDRYGTLSISLTPFSPHYFAESGLGNSTPMRRMFFHVLPGIYPKFYLIFELCLSDILPLEPLFVLQCEGFCTTLLIMRQVSRPRGQV